MLLTQGSRSGGVLLQLRNLGWLKTDVCLPGSDSELLGGVCGKVNQT